MAFRPNLSTTHINRLFDPANATVIDESELPGDGIAPRLQQGGVVQPRGATPPPPPPPDTAIPAVRTGTPNINVDALMRKAGVQGFTEQQAAEMPAAFADPNFGLYSNEARGQSETPIVFGENQQVNLAAGQSAAGNLARSAVKIAAKIPLKFAEGVVYGQNFLMEGADALAGDREMDMDLVTNGGLASLLEAWDSGLDEGALRVSKSAGYNDNSIFKNLSTNFTEWLGNEGGDGLAFTGSGFLGGGIASKLLKGASAGRALSASGSLARVEGLLGTSGRIASAQQAFLQRLPQAAMVAYNTLTEPLFEANDTYDSIYERAMNERDAAGGYKYDEQQAKQMANRGSFNAFLYNIPAVILPNIIESRILFGGMKGSRSLNPLLREAEGRIYRKTVGDFIGGYARQLPQNIVSEGGQELAQYAISKTMDDLSAQEISPLSYQMFGEVLGNVARGLGTKEGLEAAVTGGLFGLLGASAQTYGDMARGRRMAGDLAGVAESLNASPMVSMSNLYRTRPTTETVTGNDGVAVEKQGEELDLDTEGNPVIDPAKVAGKLQRNSRLQKVFALRQEALEKGDASLSQFSSDLGLATVAQDYFDQGAENVLRAKLLSYRKMTPQDFAAEGIHSEADRKAITANVDGQLAKLENLSTVYNRIKTIYGGRAIPNAPANADEPGTAGANAAPTSTRTERYDTGALYTEAAGQYVLDTARTQAKADLESLLVNLPPEVFRNNVITPADLENGFVVAGRGITPGVDTSADTFLRANELTSQQEEQVNEALSAYNRYSQAFAESKGRYRRMLSGELRTAPIGERLAKAAAQAGGLENTVENPSAADPAGTSPAGQPVSEPVQGQVTVPNQTSATPTVSPAEPTTSEPTYNVAAVAGRFAGQFGAIGYRTLAGTADADGNVTDGEVFALDADPSVQLPLGSLAAVQRAARRRNTEIARLLAGDPAALRQWNTLYNSLTGPASETYVARHFEDIKARIRTDGTIQSLPTQPLSTNENQIQATTEVAGDENEQGGETNIGTAEKPEPAIPTESPVPVRVADTGRNRNGASGQLTPEQQADNQMIALANDYNALTPWQRKQKRGNELMGRLMVLARQTGTQAGQSQGKVALTRDGRPLRRASTGTPASPVAGFRPLEDRDAGAQPLIRQAVEMMEDNPSVLAGLGMNMDARDFAGAVRDFAQGRNTRRLDAVMNLIEQAVRDWFVRHTQRAGKGSQTHDIPVEEYFALRRQSIEEIDESPVTAAIGNVLTRGDFTLEDILSVAASANPRDKNRLESTFYEDLNDDELNDFIQTLTRLTDEQARFAQEEDGTESESDLRDDRPGPQAGAVQPTGAGEIPVPNAGQPAGGQPTSGQPGAGTVSPDDVAASLKAVSLSRLFVPKSVDRAAIEQLVRNTPAGELNAKATIRAQTFADRPANYQPVDKRGRIPVYLSSQGNGAKQDTVLSVFIGEQFAGNIRPPVFYDAPQGRALSLEKVKDSLGAFGDANALLPDSELTALREANVGYQQLFDAVRAAGGEISGQAAGISLTPSQGQFAKGNPTPIRQMPALQLAGEPFYAQRTYNTKEKKYNVSAIYANGAQQAELERLGVDRDRLQGLTENVFYRKGYRNFFTLSVTPGGDVRVVPLMLPKGEKPSADTLLAELAGDVTTGANLKINYRASGQSPQATASETESVTEPAAASEQRDSILPPATSEAARRIMERLTGKFNIPGQLVSQEEAAKLLGRADNLPKGFFKDGKVYLVEGLMAQDTPFHEFAHPFVAAIAQSNPVLYANLLRQIQAENSIFSKVKTLYPELSVAEQLQEAIVQALGQRAAIAARGLSGKANGNRNQLVKLLDRFLEVVRDLLQTMSGRMTKPANISENTTLDELSKYLADDTRIDLSENPRTGIAFQKVDEPAVEEATESSDEAVDAAETEVAGSVDKGLREAVGRQVSQLLARKQEIARQGGGTRESRLTVAARTRTINNAIERLQKEVTYDALFSVAGKQLYTAEEIFRKETVTASDLNDVLRILQSVVDYDGFLNNDLLDAAQKRRKDSIAIRRSKLQNQFKDAVITTAVKESRRQGYDFSAETITAAYRDIGVAAQLALSAEETQIPVVKVMASLLKSADRQTQADYKQYEKEEAEIRAKYTKEDFARLMEDGRLITAYKNGYYAAEDAAVQRHMEVLNADASTPQQMADSYNKLFDWYKANHTYEWTEEGRELFEKDRAAIEEMMTRDGLFDADSYQRWLLENSPEFVGETDADGKYRVTVDAVASVDAKGELVNRKWYRYLKATPNATHENPRHAAVRDNPLYRFITDKYIEALKKVPHKTIVDTGGFDKVMAGLVFDVTANAFTLKNTFAGVGGFLGDTFTVAVRRADLTGENGETVDEKGRVRRMGTVPSVERLQQDRRFDNPLDLLKQFYKLATAYEHKQAVEPVLNLLEYQLSNTPALQTTLTGQVITNALTGNAETVAGGLQNALSQIRYARQVTLEGGSRTDATEVSLSEKEKDALLSGEQAEVRKLTVARVSDGMVDFSRMVSLGLKPFSALANVVMGLSANYVWAARGEGDFTEAQLNRAASTFFPSMAYFMLGGMPGVRAKLEKQHPGIAARTRKIAALANRYKITETLREGQQEGDAAQKLAGKFSQALYSLQTSGEYLIGTQIMLAMMDNTPVTNLKGEVKTLFDAYGEDGRWNTAEFGQQPEWTGLETLDETGLNTSRDKAFRDRLDQVRKRTQGDYQSPLMGKAKWYGRVLAMFRTWLPMAIRERFGKATDDGNFKGRYRTYRDVYRGVGGWDKRAKVLGLALLQTGVGTAYNVRNNVRFAASLVPGLNKTGLATMELGNLDTKTQDLLDAYLREQGMSELDIRNMRANMRELQFMLYATMLGMAFKALDAEDGDKDKELIAMINLANRTFDDMGAFYDPDTYIQLIKKPVPMMRTIDNAVDVVDSGVNLLESPTSDIYGRGNRRGESRFWGNVADAVPVVSAIRATQNTFGQVYGEEAYKYSGD